MKVGLSKSKWPIFVVGTWLLFTVSLAIWWMIYGLRQLNLLESLQAGEGDMLRRKHQMLLMEGSVLILALVSGGVALMILVLRERRRRLQIQNFFAAFSHDIKTSIASLTLQAEALAEDSPEQKKPLSRILSDMGRLHNQLENSLFFANQAQFELLNEKVDLSRSVERARYQWPELEIKYETKDFCAGDSRAVDCIIRNIIQNAVFHGKAKSVEITVHQVQGHLEMEFRDDGVGYQGDIKRLGEPGLIGETRAGTGLGIYICRELAKAMGGELKVCKVPSGFGISLKLRGAK